MTVGKADDAFLELDDALPPAGEEAAAELCPVPPPGDVSGESYLEVAEAPPGAAPARRVRVLTEDELRVVTALADDALPMLAALWPTVPDLAGSLPSPDDLEERLATARAALNQVTRRGAEWRARAEVAGAALVRRLEKLGAAPHAAACAEFLAWQLDALGRRVLAAVGDDRRLYAADLRRLDAEARVHGLGAAHVREICARHGVEVLAGEVAAWTPCTVLPGDPRTRDAAADALVAGAAQGIAAVRDGSVLEWLRANQAPDDLVDAAREARRLAEQPATALLGLWTLVWALGREGVVVEGHEVGAPEALLAQMRSARLHDSQIAAAAPVLAEWYRRRGHAAVANACEALARGDERGIARLRWALGEPFRVAGRTVADPTTLARDVLARDAARDAALDLYRDGTLLAWLESLPLGRRDARWVDDVARARERWASDELPFWQGIYRRAPRAPLRVPVGEGRAVRFGAVADLHATPRVAAVWEPLKAMLRSGQLPAWLEVAAPGIELDVCAPDTRGADGGDGALNALLWTVGHTGLVMAWGRTGYPAAAPADLVTAYQRGWQQVEAQLARGYVTDWLARFHGEHRVGGASLARALAHHAPAFATLPAGYAALLLALLCGLDYLPLDPKQPRDAATHRGYAGLDRSDHDPEAWTPLRRHIELGTARVWAARHAPELGVLDGGETEASPEPVVTQLASVGAPRPSAALAREMDVARLAAEREGAWRTAERELAQLAAERDAARRVAERDAARLAAEREAVRLVTGRELAELAAARLAAEQALAQLAAERDAARREAAERAASLAAERATAEHRAEREAERELARLVAEREAAEGETARALTRLAAERAAADAAAAGLVAAQAAAEGELARLVAEQAAAERELARLAAEREAAREARSRAAPPTEAADTVEGAFVPEPVPEVVEALDAALDAEAAELDEAALGDAAAVEAVDMALPERHEVAAALLVEAAAVTDEAALRRLRDAVNAWMGARPHHPFADLGDRMEIVEATLRPAFEVSVTTRLESRSALAARPPWRHDNVVAAPPEFDAAGFDPWAVALPEVDTYAPWRAEYLLDAPAAKRPCGGCAGTGGRECARCGAEGTRACGECEGRGRARCPRCVGFGEVLGPRGPERCPRCGGRADERCAACTYGRVRCAACDGAGRIGCEACGGRGERVERTAVVQRYAPVAALGVVAGAMDPRLAGEVRARAAEPAPVVYVEAPEIDAFALAREIPHAGLGAFVAQFLADEAARAADGARATRQRLVVRRYPAVQVRYRFDGADHELWVHGAREAVFADDSPLARHTAGLAAAALAALAAEEWDECIERLVELLRIDVEHPAGRAAAAALGDAVLAMALRGELVAARDVAVRAARVRWPECVVKLVEVERVLGRRGGARSAGPLLEEARAALARGRHERCIDRLAQLAAVHPEDAEGRALAGALGEQLVALGRSGAQGAHASARVLAVRLGAVPWPEARVALDALDAAGGRAVTAAQRRWVRRYAPAVGAALALAAAVAAHWLR